jgi:putative restriction endonuclease
MIASYDDTDRRVRLAAFAWLARQADLHGDVLPRDLLLTGFTLEGERIPLMSPQGIFKPKILEIPLTITTVAEGPYDDRFGGDGLLRYRYRGTDPLHRDNAGLRMAMQRQIPLIYFHGVMAGRYLAVWPVYIVGDHPDVLTFTVAVDDISSIHTDHTVLPAVSEDAMPRRAYITTTVRQRLHQHGFRERVLRAYREQCALCRLRHLALLDAAHIIPDAEAEGEPRVSNGLALCKLHHVAFDRFLLGITPDYTVELRQDLLDEEDGPVLKHALQEFHGAKLVLPSRRDDRPDRGLLAERYARFKEAG